MWLKNVAFELAVTLVIALATIPDLEWARWFVLVYTPLLLLIKVIALVGNGTLQALKTTESRVPAWFWHVDYAVNVALLLVDAWWIMAAAWGLVWILSIAYDRRSTASPLSSRRGKAAHHQKR